MDKFAHALLVEACPDKRAHLSSLIQQLGYVLPDQPASLTEAVRCCHDSPADILFLDADLADTIGVEVALDMIREQHDIPAVLLTSDSGKVASGYHHKHTDRLGLARAVARACGLGSTRDDFDPPQDFILSDRILLRHGERMIRVGIEEVNFFRARRNYCSIFTDDSEYLISIPIQLVEHRLGYVGFLRTHRSYLVNYQRVRGNNKNELQLAGTSVPIGRSYRRAVLRRFDDRR